VNVAEAEAARDRDANRLSAAFAVIEGVIVGIPRATGSR
jgi:hypothetical protein